MYELPILLAASVIANLFFMYLIFNEREPNTKYQIQSLESKNEIQQRRISKLERMREIDRRTIEEYEAKALVEKFKIGFGKIINDLVGVFENELNPDKSPNGCKVDEPK